MLYLDKLFNEVQGQAFKIFPEPAFYNLVICVNGPGTSKTFSALMANLIPDVQLKANAQCFPLYVYEKVTEDTNKSGSLFDSLSEGDSIINGYKRKDNISDECLSGFQATYKDTKGSKITKEDIFFYVYGILHSSEYKQRFDSDLKKMTPKIPYAKNFWIFSKAGRDLSDWHLNYETVEPFTPIQNGEIDLGVTGNFDLIKMVFAKVGSKEDRSTIIYNSHIKLGGIPLEAYEYEVNGKSAIEWVMERYQVSVDKDSGIKNNPNDWCKESGDPEYILKLLKQVIAVSIESVKIINSLPKIEELN